MKTSQKILSIVLLTGLLFLAAPAGNAEAAGACSWSGNVNANWSYEGNWGSGCTGAAGTPGSGDALTFPSGTAHLSMINDLPAISLLRLNFPASTSYTLNGNLISLSYGIVVQGGTQTINAPLAVLNNSVAFKVASGAKLSLGGTLDIGSHTLTATVNTASGVTGMEMTNTLTGGTIVSQGRLVKNGNGDLKMSGNSASAYLDIDLNAGSISTNASSPTQLPRYGTTTLSADTDLNLLNYDGVSPIAGAGDMHLSNSLIIWQSRDTTFTGDISGNGQMNIMGNKTLTLNRSGGALSFSGEIYVNVGPSHLRLLDTTATALADIRVNGNGTNSTLELNNSHVSVVRMAYPGDTKPIVATLILSGANASSASQVIVEASGCGFASRINSASDYGHIDVANPVDLGGQVVAFSLSGSYAPKPGEFFNIIHNTASGTAIKNNATFSGLAQGGVLTFNGVKLTTNYQAGGNTTFELFQPRKLYLPWAAR
jgi:hypothetical protein